MPKIKTHRGAAKRFSVTKSGKIKRAKAYKSHILTKKTTKRGRRLRKGGFIAECEAKKVREQLMPLKSAARSLNFQRATMVLRASSTVQLPSR
mgnify:CR=1 FL=1